MVEDYDALCVSGWKHDCEYTIEQAVGYAFGKRGICQVGQRSLSLT